MQLLVAVISTYKYDGEEFDENVAHSEANILHQLIEKKAYNDDEMIRILSTRSKKQLCATFNIIKDLFGTTITKVMSFNTMFSQHNTRRETHIHH
jgi:annexin A13